ncbi:MAG: thiolase family protein [Nitrososphaeraceae archaeon]
MVTPVSIVAGETSNFKRKSNLSIHQLAVEPVIKLFRNNPHLKDITIDAVILSSCSEEQYLSSIVSELLGLKPKISNRLDNLCNSGTNAISTAYSYIASGLCNSVLVIGVEKSDTSGKVHKHDLSRGEFVSPLYWGSIFKKFYQKKYNVKDEQIAKVSVKNYNNGRKNINSIFYGYKKIDIEDVLNSRLLVGTLRLLECSLLCDGASAILLTKSDYLKDVNPHNKVEIIGIGQQTNAASFGNIVSEIFESGPAKLAARQAFNMAKVDPKDLDVIEVHDAFSILEIMAYEDLNLVKKGEGYKYVTNNNIHTNVRGGILGCGHPLGATGIDQTVEIFKQLTGTNGKRQIKEKCNIGLIHNLAAAGTSASCIILQNI